ncbi:MAG: type II secretion system GspH family protein [Bdellovibrionales bacterium]|nr:type II secretion system GspH family protein [Bdellovibrionales bacterium]
MESESEPKPKQNSQSGFTLVELLISSLAGAVLLFAIPTVFLQIQKAGDSAQRRLGSVSETLVGLRALNAQLEKSGVMMSGLVDCGLTSPSCVPGSGSQSCNRSLILDIQSNGANQSPIEFIYSDRSHLAARVQSDTSGNKVQLQEAEAFPVGSLVVLSQAHRPDLAGIFKVQSNAASVLTLSDLSAGTLLASDMRCNVSQKQKTVKDVLTSSGAIIYGSDLASVVRLDRIRVVSYGRAMVDGSAVLRASIFPDFSRLAVSTSEELFRVGRLDRLRVDVEFVKDSPGGQSGTFTANSFFDFQNDRGTKDAKRSTATFQMTRSLTKNFEVVTSVTAHGQTEDASCGLVLERVAGLYLEENHRFKEYYLLTATRALPPGGGTSRLTVKVPSSAGCVLKEQFGQKNPLPARFGGSFEYPPPDLNDPNKSYSYICDFSSGGMATGELEFFDLKLGASRSVQCATAQVPEGQVTYHNTQGDRDTSGNLNSPSSDCNQDGTLKLRAYEAKRNGEIFDSHIPSYPAECCVADAAGCGACSTFTPQDCTVPAGKKLCKVQYIPDFESLSGSREVTCEP